MFHDARHIPGEIVDEISRRLNAMTAETLETARPGLLAWVESLRAPTLGQIFDAERALSEARQHVRRLKEQNLTQATADMWTGHLTPACYPWAERVALFVQGRASVTPGEVLAMLAGLPGSLSSADEACPGDRHAHTRVGRILSALGWTRRRVGKGARRHSCYTPPGQAQPPPG